MQIISFQQNFFYFLWIFYVWICPTNIIHSNILVISEQGTAKKAEIRREEVIRKKKNHLKVQRCLHLSFLHRELQLLFLVRAEYLFTMKDSKFPTCFYCPCIYYCITIMPLSKGWRGNCNTVWNVKVVQRGGRCPWKHSRMGGWGLLPPFHKYWQNSNKTKEWAPWPSDEKS